MFSMFPILSKRNAGFKSPAGIPAHAGFSAAAGLAFVALMGQAANAQRAEGPFVHFAGSWSGAGTIATSNGTRERIRCVATYAVAEAGHGLEQKTAISSMSRAMCRRRTTDCPELGPRRPVAPMGKCQEPWKTRGFWRQSEAWALRQA